MLKLSEDCTIGVPLVMAKSLGLQRFLLSTILLSIMTITELATTTQLLSIFLLCRCGILVNKLKIQ